MRAAPQISEASREATGARLGLPDVAYPVSLVLLAVGVTTVVLRLWKMTLDIPITGYAGDANFNNAAVKGLVEHGWFQTNPTLGAPFGQHLWDYPSVSVDTLQWVSMKFISLFTPQFGAIQNIYFLASFPVIALLLYFVARRLEVSQPAAALVGLLGTLLPYHFVRGENGHLFLAVYMAIPAALALALGALTDSRLFELGDRRFCGRRMPTRATWGTILFIVLVGTTGLYYALFAVALLVLAALLCLAGRRRRAAVEGAAAAVAIGAIVVISLAPNLLYRLQHGTNIAVAQRGASESETFATKLTDLVLPVTGDRVPLLSHIKDVYDASAPPPPDYGVSLGVVATIGLLILAVVGLTAIVTRIRFPMVLRASAVLAFVTFVTITVGGISSLVAYFLTPEIRGWYRFSVAIAILSLIAIGVCIDLVLERLAPRPRIAALCGVALIAAFGAAEETTNLFVPAYAATSAKWGSDVDFGSRIQALMPSGAMILSLPYTPFPESVVNGIDSYDEARPYLHTEGLRWSWGSMKGRPDDWLGTFADEPVTQLARRAAASGFLGVYLDLPGYTAPARTSAALERTLGVKPIVSRDGTQEFFDMRAYRLRLLSRLGGRRVRVLADETLYPIVAEWSTAFYPAETSGKKHWRWSSTATGSITFENPASTRRVVHFSAQLEVPRGTSDAVVTAPGGQIQVREASSPVAFAETMVLQPHSRAVVRISTGAPAFQSPPDLRTLVFALLNATVMYHGAGSAG
jgi:hypothetical protein